MTNEQAGALSKDSIVADLIYTAIDEIRDARPELTALKKDLDSSLFGPNASLDSMGLVNLVVLVEEKIGERTGKTIRLVNAKAMSPKNSPFRTVSSLADYIGELLRAAP